MLDVQKHEVRIDNGWIIKSDRGLDIYHKPISRYELGINELSLRNCLEAKIDRRPLDPCES